MTLKEIMDYKKALGLTNVSLAVKLRELTKLSDYGEVKIHPQHISDWGRGTRGPGKAISWALVELFRGVWCRGSQGFDIEAWWASNAVSRKEAYNAKRRGQSLANGTQKMRFTPLTEPDSGVLFPDTMKQWRPGIKKDVLVPPKVGGNK